jgi:hypothetical protein
MHRVLLVVLLSLIARPAASQRLTAADSSALVTAIVADLRASYKSAASGLFVRDTTRHTRGALSRQIALHLARRDTSFTPSRTTPRLGFSEPVIQGDTASVKVTDKHCTEQGALQYYGNNGTHRYIRSGSTWTAVGRGSVMHADGFTCPW